MNSQATSGITLDASTATVRKKRLLLFLIAYLVGVLSATGLTVAPSADGRSFVLSILITVPFFLSFLPFGLVFAIDGILTALGLDGPGLETKLTLLNGLHISSGDLSVIVVAGISYLLCFTIPVLGSMKSTHRAFRIFFLVFASLLIISITGWITIE